MDAIEYFTLAAILGSISIYGLVKSRRSKNEEQSERATMFGSGVSVWSVTLSVCSGFISSISLLGFPAEIYYQGGMMLWFAPMYCIAFPIVAYVFLPVLYNLKLNTIYEYFEQRFNYSCRAVTTVLFCIQMILYNSVAVYAPSLAIASITHIPIIVSIIITSILSAFYISIGGAKAGIHTSAIQMALIFLTMSFIIFISLKETSISEVYENVVAGRRLVLTDFRVNPTIRHSAWSLLIGGTGNILCLFAANQLSIQRYMAMSSLKSAQKVVLLNIVCNMFILVTYVGIGLLIFSYYKDCHPSIANNNELFPHFVKDVVSQYPGSIGLFTAAVFSAGISTLSASFTAVSSIIINDILKVYREKNNKTAMTQSEVQLAVRILPAFLSLISIFFAYLCSKLQSIILQVSFIVFGAGGGPVLGSFIVGLFMPTVRGKAAYIGLWSSIIATFSISIGSVFLNVKPVVLKLGSCSNDTTPYEYDNMFGKVTSTPIFFNLDRVFAISYQYYSIVAVLVNIIVSFTAQKLFDLTNNQLAVTDVPVPSQLISPLLGNEMKQFSKSTQELDV